MFLPGESQGRGSLVGCRLWGRTGSDATEASAAAAGVQWCSRLAFVLATGHVPCWLPSSVCLHAQLISRD